MIQFQKLKVCAGVQSAPRFESGGTSGRPKIYLLENWSGVFSNKIPKLGHVISRLLNAPDRQGAQSNSSTLATKEVLRKHVQIQFNSKRLIAPILYVISQNCSFRGVKWVQIKK